MNIKNLINYLPFYYKKADTYKDKDGKGILEKFLEIIGEYFEYLYNLISHINLDNKDLDKLSEGKVDNGDQYLRYIWEFVGSLPYGDEINKDVIKDLEQQVDLIKYSQALLKRRGSEEFFNALFYLYGWKLNSISYKDYDKDDKGWNWLNDPVDGTKILKPYADKDSMDDPQVPLDEYYGLTQCIDTTFNITVPYPDDIDKGTEQEVMKKKADFNDKYQGIIYNILKRYVPYYISPIRLIINDVFYDNIDEHRGYTLDIEYWDNTQQSWETVPFKDFDLDNLHISDSNKSFIPKFRVVVKNGSDYVNGYKIYSKLEMGVRPGTMDPNGDEYQALVSKANDFNKKVTVWERTSPYTFMVSSLVNGLNNDISENLLTNIYVFTLDKKEFHEGRDKKLTVYKSSDIRDIYHIELVDTSESVTLKNSTDIKTIKVRAYKYPENDQNDITYLSVGCVNNGQVKVPNNEGITLWETQIPDTYIFYISDNPYYQVKVKVNTYPLIYVLYTGVLSSKGEWVYKRYTNIPIYLKPNTQVKLKVVPYNLPYLEEDKYDQSFLDGKIDNGIDVSHIPIYCDELGIWRTFYNQEEIEYNRNSPVRSEFYLKDIGSETYNSVVTVISTISMYEYDLTLISPISKRLIINSKGNTERAYVIIDTKALNPNSEKDFDINSRYSDDKETGWSIKEKNSAEKVIYYDRPDDDIEWISKYEFKYFPSSEGDYTVYFRPSGETSSHVNFKVIYTPLKDLTIVKAKIVPSDYTDNHWNDINPGTDLIYHLDNTKPIAKFRIHTYIEVDIDGNKYDEIYDNDPKYQSIQCSNGKIYEIGTDIELSEAGLYTFTIGDSPNEVYRLSLNIVDYPSQIRVTCTPVTASLHPENVQGVETILNIKDYSGKYSQDQLSIKADDGTIYQNGQKFIAHIIGEYLFKPLLEGLPVEGEIAKFTVIDLDSLVVEPLELEWSPEDLSEKEIIVTTGNSNVQWEIVIS